MDGDHRSVRRSDIQMRETKKDSAVIDMPSSSGSKQENSDAPLEDEGKRKLKGKEKANAEEKEREDQGGGGRRRGVSREQKLRLYKASINCNWEKANEIFTKTPGMQYDQKLNYKDETALHVVAVAKADPEKMRLFVTALSNNMTIDSKKAKTKDGHTALYLAVVAGNLEFVKIMVPTNSDDQEAFILGNTLLNTPGGGRFKHMPLSAAALYGNYEVVKYIFDHFVTNFTNNHHTLLQYCIESDMFDIALKIVTEYTRQPADRSLHTMIFSPDNKPPYNGGAILRALARKPEAFKEAELTFLEKLGTWWNSFRCRNTRSSMKKESQALELLRLVWKDILRKSKVNHKKIRKVLVGPLGSDRHYDTVSGWDVQAIQLQEIISEYDTALVRTGHPWPIDQLETTRPVTIMIQIYEALDDMRRKTQEVIEGSPIKQEDKPVSSREHESLELRTLIFKHIANMKKEIIKGGRNLMLLSQQIMEMRDESKEIIEKYVHETPSAHIIAAEMGNTNFLIELINQYPELIWKFDGNKQSIFHIAIRQRHESIYTLLYDLGTQKDLMTLYKDPDGNSMLHLVGKIPREHRLKEVSGAALQMQRELLWFNEVKKLIPSSYSEDENSDGLTPHELFKKEHKDLCKQGEEWMKGTASQCMVVAALVATMVFTAAFTVPGGYDQKDDATKDQHYGKPVFDSDRAFMVFVLADAISLALSCVSILSFLSVLTSRFHEDDFLQSLFKRLRWGLVTLLLSVVAMMLAFGISFFVLYGKNLRWVPIVICTFAAIVIILYIFIYMRLFKDVFKSIFKNESLFKHKEHGLFYEDS